MRKNGFYWVKWGFDWTIAIFVDSHWEMIGSGFEMSEDDFDAIGDKIDIPEKYR